MDANYAAWPGFKAQPGTHMSIGLYDGASGAQLIGDTIGALDWPPRA